MTPLTQSIVRLISDGNATPNESMTELSYQQDRIRVHCTGRVWLRDLQCWLPLDWTQRRSVRRAFERAKRRVIAEAVRAYNARRA